MNDEPRTTADIIRDFLEFTQEHEWFMEYIRCGHGCCGKWEHHCLSCGNDQKSGHKSDCRLASMIKEAEAFLAVENEIEQQESAQNHRDRLGWKPLDDDQRADQLNANLDDILGP
jgi:hypothetical protein